MCGLHRTGGGVWLPIAIPCGFFADGVFSVSLVDATRNDDWITEFPKNLQELGYESFAGAYDLSGSTLTLGLDITLNPFHYHEKKTFSFVLKGDTLTLTEKLRPYTEDLRNGERVIVLARTSPLKNK